MTTDELTIDEQVGLYSVVAGLFAVGLLWPPPVHAAEEQLFLCRGLLISAPQDDSPCVEDPRYPVYPWGHDVLQKLALAFRGRSLGQKALPQNIRDSILEHNPERLYLFGHGLDWINTCEKCEQFLNSRTGLNMDLVSGRYVHLLSCLCARELGRKTIEAGALAFFGYYEPFWLLVMYIGDKRASGRLFEAPFYGDLEIEIQFQNGERDLEVIYNKAIQRFNDEIAYWEEHWDEERVDGRAVSPEMAQVLIDVLISNRDALRCYHPAGRYAKFPDEELEDARQTTYAGIR